MEELPDFCWTVHRIFVEETVLVRKSEECHLLSMTDIHRPEWGTALLVCNHLEKNPVPRLCEFLFLAAERMTLGLKDPMDWLILHLCPSPLGTGLAQLSSSIRRMMSTLYSLRICVSNISFCLSSILATASRGLPLCWVVARTSQKSEPVWD